MHHLKRLMPALLLVCVTSAVAAGQPDPTALLQSAFDLWRGKSSYTELTMTVHRPEWERSMSLKGWTRGKSDSLVRFTAPAKDAGNATLMLGHTTWIFNPRINQIIQVPGGMMAQSWMGSDFSYDDLAKSDSVLRDYTHKLIKTEMQDGHEMYTVEAIPKPDAAVVWGKQVIRIRDDRMLMQETFFDQDMKPVRELDTTRIGKLGGRLYPVQMTMKTLDKPGHWTRIDYTSGRFDLDLPDYLFTNANLRNPRPWKRP